MDVFRRVIERARVVANLTDGSAIDGVFYRQRGPLLVFKDATLLQHGAEAVRLDGDVVVERDRVVFIQVP